MINYKIINFLKDEIKLSFNSFDRKDLEILARHSFDNVKFIDVEDISIDLYDISVLKFAIRRRIQKEPISQIEDAHKEIIDYLGKNDIEWEYLGEMYDPRTKRITYEEVINDADTSTRSIQTEKVTGSTMGAGAS